MNGRTDLQTFRAPLTEEGRSLPAALAAAADEQVRLRGRAAAKFGEFAPRMYLTPDIVELSSHLAVSEYKLHRVLHEIGVVRIEALCLGSGADALVLSRSHHTMAVDADPLTVEIAAANAPVMDARLFLSHCEDTAGLDGRGEAVFIDLMRRPGPDGVHDPESYSPPLTWTLDRVRTTGAGWVRLAPGLPPGAVPGLGRADEAEWISYAGVAQELVLWFGLHRGPAPVTARKATLLPAGASLTTRGLPGPSVRPLGRYVYVPDPAVVQAGLIAEVAEDIAGGPLDGGGTLLTSDELRHTPFAAAYEVTGVPARSGGRRTPANAPEAPEASEASEASVEFAVAATDGPTTLTAVPVRFP
ncbi:SAM-dependent methyltransferase [Streptomyces sp. NPDC048723]|uniref:SAM-dependent methyltransferase n=1 Tax=Streptomyces sp. NPDC048723 TaxID=3365589 RepID=UPI00371D9E5A